VYAHRFCEFSGVPSLVTLLISVDCMAVILGFLVLYSKSESSARLSLSTFHVWLTMIDFAWQDEKTESTGSAFEASSNKKYPLKGIVYSVIQLGLLRDPLRCGGICYKINDAAASQLSFFMCCRL
jgi:hypothetical protein